MEMIHQNSDVGSSITSFIEGEKKHSVEKKLLEDTKKQKDVLESDANTKKDCFITLPVSTTLPSKKKRKA